MKKSYRIWVLMLGMVSLTAFGNQTATGDRLRSMRKGVWLNSAGVYTVWTDQHYFVISASGEGAKANVYCGASEIRITDRGIARKQNVRMRRMGSGEPTIFTDFEAFRRDAASRMEEVPLQIDPGLFDPTKCVVDHGVIYDSVAEETDEYILLATCNGDREKIFTDGRAVYLPASGGEFWSYRIETLD